MTNELIKLTHSKNGEVAVSGRELYVFLEVKERYSKWFERMIGYGFENEVDYTRTKRYTLRIITGNIRIFCVF